jgi:hypothetical protein
MTTFTLTCDGATFKEMLAAFTDAMQRIRADGLRACLKRSRSGCETPHHQVDHGNSDPCLSGFRQGFEICTEPPRAIEPAEGAFHNPAPLQDLKTFSVPRTFHDHESPSPARRDPRNELARIPPIRPEQLESREASDQCRQDRFGAITVLDAGRMDYHDQQETEDIDHNVALAPADALAAVIAAEPPFSVVFTV